MAQSRKQKDSSGRTKLFERLRTKSLMFDADGDLVESRALDDFIIVAYSAMRKEMLTDLANLRDRTAVDWFWRQWEECFKPESPADLINLRDQLRVIWQANDLDSYRGVELTPELMQPTLILNKWLAWQPSSEFLADLNKWENREADDERDFGEFDLVESDKADEEPYLPFECSIVSRKLVPNFTSLRAMLIQGVFENWGYLKQCQNPQCLAPYFIAKRRDQSVCDAGVCKAEIQRERARTWWNANRAKQASGKNQKQAANRQPQNRSKRDVTRKTR